MAALAGYGITLSFDGGAVLHGNPKDAHATTLGNSGTVTVTHYKMIGMDKNTDGLWDSWSVTGSADYTGASYAGALATPLRAIAKAGEWTT